MYAIPKIDLFKTYFPGPKIGMNEAYIYQVSPSQYLSHT
jgi:hypothetical protein